jgi:hypothetical protein
MDEDQATPSSNLGRFIAFTEECLTSVGNGEVGAVICIIRATCIEEDLLGGHVVAEEHVGEGLSLLWHAVSTPNVLAFSKSVWIVLGVYRIGACEFVVNHALHEASQRIFVGSRAPRSATCTEVCACLCNVIVARHSIQSRAGCDKGPMVGAVADSLSQSSTWSVEARQKWRASGGRAQGRKEAASQ